MPVLSAVSGSARQLWLLLRCIGFASKAHVTISSEGLRFSVDDSRALQGLAFLDKALFTTYTFTTPAPAAETPTQSSTNQNEETNHQFQISLPALLETLQIFGTTDTRESSTVREGTYDALPRNSATANANAAFDNRTLGLAGTCRLAYEGAGTPLRIHLEEGKVTTVCDLTVYEPDYTEDIPFDRDALALKIIMRASVLHDAVSELASVGPERLLITASPTTSAPTTPSLSLSATGSHGSACVDFAHDAQILETFQVPRRFRNSYKFSMVKSAGRAMAAAAKVSVRGDRQGVLSLQFMIETEGGGVSFVDFRFVPFVEEDGEEGDGGDEGGNEEDGNDEE